MSATIVISGAGGWLGKELIQWLLDTRGADYVRSHCTLLTSDGRGLHFSRYGRFQTESFSTWIPTKPVNWFFPFAFPTMDKVGQFGIEKYEDIALAVIERHKFLIRQTEPDGIGLVSSGAVYQHNSMGGRFVSHFEESPYGFCKLLEEKHLARVASEIGAQLVIGRLWAGLGLHINLDKSYAAVNFFLQAVESEEIHVRASRETYRRYCDVAAFLQLIYRLVEQRKSIIFDSGGEILEMSELAEKIAQTVPNSNLQIRRAETAGEPEKYFTTSTQFERLIERHAIEVSPTPLLLQRMYKRITGGKLTK